MLGLLVSSFALTACGSDDDDNNPASSIVGTWRLDDGYEIEELTLASNSSATYQRYRRDNEGKYATYGNADEGKYTINGNTLTIKWWDDDDEVEVFQFVVSGNTLTLTDERGRSENYTRYK